MTTAVQGQLLDPQVISRLGSIDFIARALVEGFLVGLHRSPYHGFSVEFAEYRQYQPGESTQYVDWRVYAKSDRHYVKVFHEETNLSARLLLDISASMAAHPEPEAADTRLTKLEYGKLLAAALSYLFIKQNDAVGLTTFDDSIREMVPPRSQRRQLHRILNVLQHVEPGSTTDVGRVLNEMAGRMWRRGLVVVISDLVDELDAVLAGLKHFRHRQHEVLVFHVLDPREVDLAFDRPAEFHDPEGEVEKLEAQPWHLRREYTRAISEWRRQMSLECGQHRIDFVPLTTDTPFEHALLSYLNKRNRVR
jgi:uncharacterized protein (DUF58 family)